METLECIKRRRSVRLFLRKEVEEEKLCKVLEAATYAPSAGNIQDWNFIVVRDERKRFQLAEAAYGQYWMSDAPILIVVCARLDKAEEAYGKRGRELYTYQDTAAAIQNMLLAACDLGLGTCWVGAFDEDQVIGILRISEEARPVAIIALGYPAEKPVAPPRLGIENVTFFEEWGKKWIRE